jgi:hypothetical protein
VATAGFIHGCPHGQEHVDAGVTIGHGEDVKRVNRLCAALQPQGTGAEHGFKFMPIAIGNIIQNRAPFDSLSSRFSGLMLFGHLPDSLYCVIFLN